MHVSWYRYSKVRAYMTKIRVFTFETFLKPEEIAEYISFILSFDSELISEEVRVNRLKVQ